MSFSVPILLLKYRQFLRIPACCAHTCTIDHPRHMVCRNRRFVPNLRDSHPTERIRRTILLDRQNRFYLAIVIFDYLTSIIPAEICQNRIGPPRLQRSKVMLAERISVWRPEDIRECEEQGVRSIK